MDWWEDGFCERLMAGSRFVIRYDHRDTGRSSASRGLRPTAARPSGGRRRPARRLRPGERPSVGMSVGVDRPARGARPSRSGRIANPYLDEPYCWAKRSRPSRDVRGATNFFRGRGL